MFKKNSLVSIIIPVYNGEKFLKEAINSVLEQTYDNWELIIVNDASTDSSAKIARDYASSNNKIRLFNHSQNKYRSGALNTGITKARGEFICFLDADDIYFKDKTASQVDFLNKNPKIDMVYSNLEIFDESGGKNYREAIDFKEDPKQLLLDVSEKFIKPHTSSHIILGYKNDFKIIPSCSVMIRREVFESVKFDENLKTGQDYDLWFQIIGQGYKVAKLPILSYYYRSHPGQITNTKNKETKDKSASYIISKLKSWEYFKIPGKSKPKILLVPNVHNWAYDFEADQIIKNFSEQFDFTKRYHGDFCIGTENYSKYDKIYSFFWSGAYHFFEQLTSEELKEKLVVGIFSYNSWEGKINELKKILKRCNSLVSNDKKILEKFKSPHYKSYYVKKWVDCNHFKPLTKKSSEKLVVGWAGNPNHHGISYKGYWDILIPVCKKNSNWLTLKSALKNVNPITYEKMPEFYNGIDVNTCLSKGETGPNSLLEAGACAVPSISVDTGIASELIKNNWNGIIIKRNQKALENALRKLYENRNLAKTMGERTKQIVLKEWTCEKNIQTYQKIFKS